MYNKFVTLSHTRNAYSVQNLNHSIDNDKKAVRLVASGRLLFCDCLSPLTRLLRNKNFLLLTFYFPARSPLTGYLAQWTAQGDYLL